MNFINDDNRCPVSVFICLVGFTLFVISIIFISFTITDKENRIVYLVLCLIFLLIGTTLMGVCLKISKIYTHFRLYETYDKE